MRTELLDILSFAEKVNSGDSKAAELQLQSSSHVLTHRLPASHPQSGKGANSSHATYKQLLELGKENFSYLASYDSGIAHMATLLPKFRILSPFREGPWGVETINALFINELRSKKQGLFIAPIMLTTNDWHKELFNGEVGLLIRHNCHSPIFLQEDYAIFVQGDKMREVPALSLPKFEYAYAMSIHKSQGSEFDHVLLILPDGSESFGREVLYTGITRAKKQLDIWASHETLSKTIAQQGNRESGIAVRLR
jgi:exodeoxyribonuclease V alpha subunit